MEVLLAKKRSQAKQSETIGFDLPVEAGKRAVVRKGKDFEKFRSGDEGRVLSISEDDDTCQVQFDGSIAPITVAIRHLSGVSSGQVNGRRGSKSETPRSLPGGEIDATKLFVDDGKLTLARWKPKKASLEGNRPAPVASPTRHNIIAKSIWRDDAEENCWSPERRSPDESPRVDAQFSDEPSLRKMLQQCLFVMKGNLQASEVFASGHASISGEVFLRVSEASFKNWQHSLAGLQRSVESCMRELYPASTANPFSTVSSPPQTPRDPNTSIVVPVETLGYRQELGTTYGVVPLPGDSARSEVPSIPSLGFLGRSMSVPPLRNLPQNMSPLCSPRPGGIGGGAVLSPRFMGVTSATPHVLSSVNSPRSLSPGPGHPNPAWISQEQKSVPLHLASKPNTMLLAPARPTREVAASPSRVLTGLTPLPAGQWSRSECSMTVKKPSNTRAKMHTRALATRDLTGPSPKATYTARSRKRSPKRKSFSEWISEEFSWVGGNDSSSEGERR